MEALFAGIGVRTYFVVLLFAGLTAYLIYRKIHRKNLINFYSVVMCVILVLNGYNEIKLLYVQSIATEIVSEVSGNSKAHLKCQRLSSALFDASTTRKGEVMYAAPNTAVLKYEPCKDLGKFLLGNKVNPKDEEILSFAILLHESVHTSGEFEEAMTECLTHSIFVEEAVKAGVEESTANSMLLIYLDKYHKNQSNKYQYSEGLCREHPLITDVQ